MDEAVYAPGDEHEYNEEDDNDNGDGIVFLNHSCGRCASWRRPSELNTKLKIFVDVDVLNRVPAMPGDLSWRYIYCVCACDWQDCVFQKYAVESFKQLVNCEPFMVQLSWIFSEAYQTNPTRLTKWLGKAVAKCVSQAAMIYNMQMEGS